MRFDRAHLMWKERRDQFRYVVERRPFAELRRQPQGGEIVKPDPMSGFLIAGRFVDMLGDLLPANQNKARFRFLGRIAKGGARSLVVAFAELDGSRQGLVWVDEATKQIVRFRTDDSFTRDVHFVPVNFPALETMVWLPSSATVHARFAAGELHSLHRFSDYDVEGSKNDTGVAAQPATTDDDAFEVLLKGVAALEAGKPGDAIAPLQDASVRLADRVEPGYYLGLALYQTHDLAGAETRFRETVKRFPSLAVAHNELGTVLFDRGDKPGALAEFQEALRLAPGDAGIRDNLRAAESEATIQVNVRQVLVPVVVTDKQGHHVTGLKQADFTVFEDGVEQNITAFTSEREDVSVPASPSPEPGLPNTVATVSPTPQAERHAYVICLDMMHASFGNFAYVRSALQKLFREEQPGNSQYAVIALGRSIEIVQNTTSDPAKVLESLGGAAFRKIYQQSQKSSSQSEMSQFENALQEVRAACDVGNIECNRKPTLPTQANQLAEHERFWTTKFAAELRSIVEQLAGGRGRRMLVLISDGFSLAPGGTSFGLLEAYFPEFRSTRTIERVQDVIEPIYRLAVKGNVPIYTIDSRGLYTPPGYDVSRGVLTPEVNSALNTIAMQEGQTLLEIASATGGTGFQNSNDLLAGLKKAFADGREYYMLAYVPSNEAQDGKFRKIDVRVRNNKASVSAKRGYWASSQ